jgi:hypothetical protein
MNVGGLGIRPELLRNLPNAREPGKPPLKQFALEYDPDRATEDWERGLYTLRGRVIAPLEPPIRRVRNVLTFGSGPPTWHQPVESIAITCASFVSPDVYRPCNPADACRAHLRQHCEPPVPRASSWLAFGSSQCRLLWARPRPRTRLIRRSQNVCVADLSLDMARRYTRTVLMISRGFPDCLLVNQLFVAPREKESSAHAVGHGNRASDQGTAI